MIFHSTLVMIRNLPFCKDIEYLGNHIFHFLLQMDRQIMQDLEWQGCCAISGAYMTLFGICCWIMVMLAILYALDEQDMENFVFTIRDFLQRMVAGI